MLTVKDSLLRVLRWYTADILIYFAEICDDSMTMVQALALFFFLSFGKRKSSESGA